MQAIILAGGLGTRLRSVVNDRPKPMAQVVNKPFVEYLLDELREAGIVDIIFAVGYKGETFEAYFGNGSEWDLNIQYAYEEELLGTAGAIKNTQGLIRSENLLIMNGDTYYKMDYKDLINFGMSNQLDMGIVLRKVSDISRYGKVTLENNRIVGFNEKETSNSPGLINGGVYFMKADLIKAIPIGKVSLENEMIPCWLKTGKKLGGIVSNQYFIDIGVPDDYYKFVKDTGDRNSEYKRRMIEGINHLLEEHVTASSSSLTLWKHEMRICMREVYGVRSEEYKRYLGVKFEPDMLSIKDGYRAKMEMFCKERLLELKGLLGKDE